MMTVSNCISFCGYFYYWKIADRRTEWRELEIGNLLSHFIYIWIELQPSIQNGGYVDTSEYNIYQQRTVALVIPECVLYETRKKLLLR